MGGADDVTLVMSALAGHVPVCTDCLARRTGIPRADIPSVMDRIRENVRVQRPRVHCAVCRRKRHGYRVRELGTSNLRLVMVALWNDRLCTTCLVEQTGVPTPKIHEMLTALGRVLVVTWTAANCEGCSAARPIPMLA